MVKIKEKINQNNLFECNLYKWDFQTCMIPISNIILDLARIEMVIHNGFIEVKLCSPNDYHTGIYDYLLDHKEEIEKELEFELNYFKAKYWRISIYTQLDIAEKDNKENFYPYEPYIRFLKPQKVYMGMDISEKDEKLIKNICKIKKIPLFKAIKNKNEYKFDFDEVVI